MAQMTLGLHHLLVGFDLSLTHFSSQRNTLSGGEPEPSPAATSHQPDDQFAWKYGMFSSIYISVFSGQIRKKIEDNLLRASIDETFLSI